jgi:methylisocitrate lyase
MTVGAPPTILSYSEVCEGVGFNKYWEREEKYKFEKFYKGEKNGANGKR